jgi:uncharacterized Ntn-hydrolase superfamily protein
MTFSIVARCPRTQSLGIGVSTAAPAVGNRVLHVKANIGAIATQANTNINYGIKGLRLLKLGFSPQTSLEAMLKEDLEKETRQVIIIDIKGRTAAFTGKETIPWKGHFVSKDFIVAGNMLVGKKVLKAMEETFENSPIELAERILKALEAGDKVDGDKRGKLSAALMVVDGKGEEMPPSINLRVDMSLNPVRELRKLFERCKKFMQ